MVKFTLKGISNLTESPAYFQQVNGIYRKDGALAEMGKLFYSYDDTVSECLSFIGNIPAQLAGFLLAYYGAIAFMPNTNEFLDTILTTLGIDPLADNIAEFSGFYVFLGWAVNFGMQGLTLPSNLFRPMLRAFFAQDHLLKRAAKSLAILVPSACIAYNMVGLITQTEDVSNEWTTLIPAAAANLNITSSIYGLVQGPGDLDHFKTFCIRMIRALQEQRTLLTEGQLSPEHTQTLIRQTEQMLNEFRGRAEGPTVSEMPIPTAQPGEPPSPQEQLQAARVQLNGARYGNQQHEGHWYDGVCNFFRRLCGNTYRVAEIPTEQSQARQLS